MLVVGTIAKIRRLHFAQGRAIKAICRQPGLSRKSARKVLQSDAAEFRYEQIHRMPFVRAYLRKTQEMVFDMHDRVFAFFQGACTRASMTT
jgi:transposase